MAPSQLILTQHLTGSVVSSPDTKDEKLINEEWQKALKRAESDQSVSLIIHLLVRPISNDVLLRRSWTRERGSIEADEIFGKLDTLDINQGESIDSAFQKRNKIIAAAARVFLELPLLPSLQ